MKAYFETLEGLEGKAPSPPSTPREATFYWLVDQYYRSPEFKGFDELTRADKMSVLNRFCVVAGNLPFVAFRTEDVIASRDKRSAKPGAADKLVKYLRALFKWAVNNKKAKFNPAIGVGKIHETKGWHTWTAAQVAQYRERHEIGTKARLALEIMLNIGARPSDACRIGRQHEVDGYLEFVAWKVDVVRRLAGRSLRGSRKS